MTAETDEDARHKAKMANRNAVQDAEVAAKTIEKGLLIVHTGKGKGKSTAAFGLLLRAIGRGFQCGVVQFGKGAWQTGERSAIERVGDQVKWHTLGEGFTWETQDRARDVALSESTRTSHCNSLHEKSRPSRTAKLVQWYSCGLKTRLALLRIGRTARTRKNVVLGKSRIVPALQGWFGEVPASRATTAGRGAYRGGRRN